MLLNVGFAFWATMLPLEDEYIVADKQAALFA